VQTLNGLQALRHPQGGFREFGEHPFQSNAHMHLLEAALAWEDAGGGGVWAELADEVAALALSRFIDAQGGFLREFFDAGWAVAAGDDGRWVEPGHQFEWAWLLEAWGRRRGQAGARAAARRLFETGRKGVDPRRGVAVDVLWDDLTPRAEGARLWPQTERLKSALILGDEGEALLAARTLTRYLDTPAPGVWRDKMTTDGSFVAEPAPASSFYHIASAVLELRRWRAGGGPTRLV
jgi:mannose-6-phosphate isomerase